MLLFGDRCGSRISIPTYAASMRHIHHVILLFVVVVVVVVIVVCDC